MVRGGCEGGRWAGGCLWLLRLLALVLVLVLVLASLVGGLR